MALTKVIGAGLGTVTSADLDGAVTINESSADKDFRVESNGNANMLFVDGENDRVGIGTSTFGASTHKLEVDGGSAETRLRISTTGTDAREAGIILANSSKSSDNDGIVIAHGGAVTTFDDLGGNELMRIAQTSNHAQLLISLTDTTPFNSGAPGMVIALNDGTRYGAIFGCDQVANRDAVVFVDNCLRGAGLRDRVKVAASGKILSAYDIIRLCALGSDWCNMARPFMFSIGCIQARDCASSNCPSGVATMNPGRYRVIDVNDRAKRVHNFHRNTVIAVIEMLEAAGLQHTHELNRRHIVRRLSASQIKLADQIYPRVETDALINGGVVDDPRLAAYWDRVNGDSFQPVDNNRLYV